MNKVKRKVNKATIGIMVMLTLVISNVSIVFAKGEADISKTILFTGTKNLVSDVQKGLLGLVAVIAITLFIYFMVRHKMAEETEQKMWKKRAIGTVVAAVCAVVAVVIIPVILSYYTSK